MLLSRLYSNSLGVCLRFYCHMLLAVIYHFSFALKQILLISWKHLKKCGMEGFGLEKVKQVLCKVCFLKFEKLSHNCLSSKKAHFVLSSHIGYELYVRKAE